MVDYDTAKSDPASFFKHPSDILKDHALTRHEKIDLLRRWAYDEREMAVAEEENMIGEDHDNENTLDEILEALLTLGVDSDQPDPPPTEQG